VVLTNIPDGATAVGLPARIVPYKPVSIVYEAEARAENQG
jgi:serine acetyltransferase